jgi:hypothetical protein
MLSTLLSNLSEVVLKEQKGKETCVRNATVGELSQKDAYIKYRTAMGNNTLSTAVISTRLKAKQKTVVKYLRILEDRNLVKCVGTCVVVGGKTMLTWRWLNP